MGAAFLGEKRIQGSLMGSNRFPVDMPRLVDFYMSGKLKLDDMISANQAGGHQRGIRRDEDRQDGAQHHHVRCIGVCVVPANAGAHPRDLIENAKRQTLFAKPKPVTMGPGVRPRACTHF